MGEKRTHFNCSIETHQDILALDVAVDDRLGQVVEVIQSLKDELAYCGYVSLFHRLIHHQQFAERTSIDVFHHHLSIKECKRECGVVKGRGCDSCTYPQHAVYNITVHIIYNGVMVALFHDHNLVDDDLLLDLLSNYHLLDSHHHSRSRIDRLEYRSRCPIVMCCA